MTAPPIDWHDVDTDTEPADHQPSPFDCRRYEMDDLSDQRAGRVALWTADTVPTGSYL